MTILPQDTRRPSHMTVAIRSGDLRIDADLRDAIGERVRRSFRRHARRVREVRVWLDDLNGPRGGVDRTCRIQVQLTAAGTSTVESRAQTVHAAVAGAVARAKQTIDRTLKRRRTRARFPREPRNRNDGRDGHGRLWLHSESLDPVPASIMEGT